MYRPAAAGARYPRRHFYLKEKAGVGALADIGCYALDFALNSIGYRNR